MPQWKILDCTLRDGGYYTNWDFNPDLVAAYFKAIASLPVSIVELGYRADPKAEYFGAYYYLPKYLLEWARSLQPEGPDFAVMLNAKDCTPAGIPRLLADCRGLVRLVRMAVNPETIDEALALSHEIKGAGFEVALNLMYLSKDYAKGAVFEKIAKRSDLVDYVALVDSFGACFPEQVAESTRLAKQILPMPVGFHGHDNMTLAFANSLAAIGAGADMVDSTITGMGRGAGNLRTEVIAGYYHSQDGKMTDFMEASPCIEEFERMKTKYAWGAQLPYVVAGLNNLPQAQVMDWLAQERYSTSVIVGALRKPDVPVASTEVFPPVVASGVDRPCIVVGGGASVKFHEQAIEKFVAQTNAALVFSSTRHIGLFQQCQTDRFLCLVGDEYAKTDELALQSDSRLRGIWVDSSGYVGVPSSSPVWDRVKDVRSVQPLIRSDNALLGNACPFGLAVAGAIASGWREIYMVGFDGYQASTSKARALTAETQSVIDRVRIEMEGVSLRTLTPSSYTVEHSSIYALLSAPR